MCICDLGSFEALLYSIHHLVLTTCHNHTCSPPTNALQDAQTPGICLTTPSIPASHDTTYAVFALSSSWFFLSCSLGGSTSGPKLSGSSSPIVLTIHFPSLLNMKMGVSSARNSRKNCLHIPHGEQKSSMSVVTPTALKLPMRWPAITAVPMATRSAHVPTG